MHSVGSSVEPVTPPARNARPDGSWTARYVFLYAAYAVVALTFRLLMNPLHGDVVVFVNATHRLLDGSWDLYSALSVPSSAPPLGTGYTYSPLLTIVLAPFVALADALGWGAEGGGRLEVIPLVCIDILAMQQLRRVVRQIRPDVDERFLFLGISLSLFLTSFLLVTADRGHDEGMVLLFLLLTFRFASTKLIMSGLCAGLALAAKQTALLELVPIGVVLLAGGYWSTGRGEEVEAKGSAAGLSLLERPAARFALWASIAAGVFLLFILPPWVANPSATQYALVTVTSRLELYGTGLPVWVDRALQGNLSPDAYAIAHQAILQYSNQALVGVVALGCVAAVVTAKKRGGAIEPVDERLLALIAFAGVSQLVLGKWTGGHYYQLPLLLVFLWDVVRTAPRPEASAYARVRQVGAVPVMGLAAAVAFRSITQLNPAWLKDLLILAMFLVLAMVTWAGAVRGRVGEAIEES